MSESGNSAHQGGSYRVLARKYRPASFDDLIGQEPMVRTLRNAFAAGRIAHAWMLTGVRRRQDDDGADSGARAEFPARR